MARPETDVDPHNMDARPRKRRRKDRSKPDPHPLNVAVKAKTEARLAAMPGNPGVMFEPTAEGWRLESIHSDTDLWRAQIAAAFGTNSDSVVRVFLRDLEGLCARAYDDDLRRWKPCERELNAALAMVNDIQPRTTMEAALAAQMVAIHWMQMRLSKDALNNGGMVMDRSAALASKMARTFTMQLDQLRALRGEKRSIKQTIKVEKTLRQEVHYHDHREGVGDFQGQAHEPRDAKPARIIDQRAPVRGEDKGGVVLPITRAQG